MPEDHLYEQSRSTNRSAAAASLRKLADRLDAGDQLLPADGNGGPLEAPEEVDMTLRAIHGDQVTVEVKLAWADSPSQTRAEYQAEQSGQSDRKRQNEDGDPHESTGWASAGASEGYSLPLRDSLDDADDEFERAAYFLRKGKHEAALSRFENAIEQTPEDPRRRYHVATVCWQLGEVAQAAQHFRAGRELAQDDIVIALDFASFLWSQGRISRAGDIYEEALEIAPDEPDVHSALGRFRWETDGDVESAVEHCKRAIDLDDDHGLAHCNYAVLLRHGGKHDHAEQHFRRALSLRGDDPIVQKEYGHFRWEQGEIEEAARHYAKAE